MKKNITQNLKSIILALILVAGVSYVSASSTWAPPTATPPNPNADTPLNVGSTAQIKAGPLTMGGLGITGDFKFLPTSGTAPTSGQVLMADDSDLAHGQVKWGTASGGGGGGAPAVTGGYQLMANDGEGGATASKTDIACASPWGTGTCTSASQGSCGSGTTVHSYVGVSGGLDSSISNVVGVNGLAYVSPSPLRAYGAAGYAITQFYCLGPGQAYNPSGTTGWYGGNGVAVDTGNDGPGCHAPDDGPNCPSGYYQIGQDSCLHSNGAYYTDAVECKAF